LRLLVIGGFVGAAETDGVRQPKSRTYLRDKMNSFSSTKDLPKLIETLRAKDISWEERKAAINTLINLGDTQVVEPLIVILENKNEDEAARDAAVQVLGKLGDLRACKPLVFILQRDDEDMFLRSRSAEALGNLGDTEAVAPLIQVLENPGEIVWSAAATALKKFDITQAQQALNAYKSPKVLQVEDSLESRNVIKYLLEASGYEVIEVFTAKEGFQKATEIKPDIILTDVNLPGLDGYEFAKMLKSSKKTASIPRLALAARPFKAEEEQIFDECISKPIDVSEFLGQVARYLKKKT
jgi:HEAT repeat protein